MPPNTITSSPPSPPPNSKESAAAVSLSGTASPVNLEESPIKSTSESVTTTSIVSLTSYDAAPKEWEAFVKSGRNVADKIQKFEERIQHLNASNIAETPRKPYKNVKGLITDENNDYLPIDEDLVKHCSSNSSDKDSCFEEELLIPSRSSSSYSSTYDSIVDSDILAPTPVIPEIRHTLKAVSNAEIPYGRHTRNKSVSIKYRKQEQPSTSTTQRILQSYRYCCALYGLYIIGLGGGVLLATFVWAVCMFLMFSAAHFAFRITTSAERFGKLHYLLQFWSPLISESSEVWTQTKPLPSLKQFTVAMMLPLVAMMVPWILWKESLLVSYMIPVQLQHIAGVYLIRKIKSKSVYN